MSIIIPMAVLLVSMLIAIYSLVSDSRALVPMLIMMLIILVGQVLIKGV